MFQKNRVPVESLLGAGAIDCWAGLLGIAGGDLFHHQPGRREVCDKGCASMPVCAVRYHQPPCISGLRLGSHV